MRENRGNGRKLDGFPFLVRHQDCFECCEQCNFKKMAYLIRSLNFSLPTRWCSQCRFRTTFALRNSFKVFERHFATQHKHDITLFKYERRTLYKILGLASFSQLTFWSYMSYVMYVYIRPASQMLQEHKLKSSSDDSETFKEFKLFPNFLLSPKVQTGVSIASLGMGILFFFTGCIYAIRSVSQVTLLHNGGRILVKTYTPFGGTKQFSVPLNEVSCSGSRLDNKSFVVFKIKNHRFFYMVDKRGEFLQPTLFDKTVGVRRWSL